MHHPDNPEKDIDQSSSARKSANWPTIVSALEFPQYRWLFFSNLAFFFAMQGQILTRSFLAWELTHSELSLAIINLIVAIPFLLASVIGGAITDRVERRRLVIIGQALILFNETVIFSLIVSGYIQFWHLLCTAFIAGCAWPFIMPARMAIVYKTVGPERLGNAMALSAGSLNLARVAAPALMGVVINLIDITGAYLFAIVLYSIAVLCMFAVHKDEAQQTDRKHLIEDIKLGFDYVFAHRPVLLCLLFGLLPMFLAMPFQNILVVFADEVWQVGERGFGILMGATGIGGVLGSVWVAHRGDNTGRLIFMVVSAIGFALFLGIFCLTPNFYWALLPLVLANVFASSCQTLNNTAIQLLIHDHVRGRMSSLMMMSFGFTPLGVLPMAFFAEKIGAPFAVLGACIGLTIGVAIFCLASPTFRQLDACLMAKRQSVS